MTKYYTMEQFVKSKSIRDEISVRYRQLSAEHKNLPKTRRKQTVMRLLGEEYPGIDLAAVFRAARAKMRDEDMSEMAQVSHDFQVTVSHELPVVIEDADTMGNDRVNGHQALQDWPSIWCYPNGKPSGDKFITWLFLQRDWQIGEEFVFQPHLFIEGFNLPQAKYLTGAFHPSATNRSSLQRAGWRFETKWVGMEFRVKIIDKPTPPEPPQATEPTPAPDGPPDRQPQLLLQAMRQMMRDNNEELIQQVRQEIRAEVRKEIDDLLG